MRFEVGWALNDKTSDISKYHTKRGKFLMTIKRNGTPSFPCTKQCPVKRTVVAPVKRTVVEKHGPDGKKIKKGVYLNAKKVGDDIEFTVRLPVNSWFGLSLGRKSMVNVDMVVFKNVNGTRSVQDYHGNRFAQPIYDYK